MWGGVIVGGLALLVLLVVMVLKGPDLIGSLRATATPTVAPVEPPVVVDDVTPEPPPVETPEPTQVVEPVSPAYDLETNLTLNPPTPSVGDRVTLTVGMTNRGTTDVVLQELELLGNWEPTLVLTGGQGANVQVSPPVTLALGAQWSEAFVFEARQASANANLAVLMHLRVVDDFPHIDAIMRELAFSVAQ